MKLASHEIVPSPLFRDPIHDGAADPTVIWNRDEGTWWMFYTNRRAWSPPLDDVGWVHGTDIGIASSCDGGVSWLYRGVASGLATDPGRHTYWAPEVIDDGLRYHMYVSFITGVPARWSGHPRSIRHYTSANLTEWEYQSTLTLSSDRVIDACVHPIPRGGYRMWYKDEANQSHTYAADSADLFSWKVRGPVVAHSAHEGPNVFELGGFYWMLIDEWAGLRVLRSSDLDEWTLHDRILDTPGTRVDDGTIGLHADVVTAGDDAFVFYFTQPGRSPGEAPRNGLFEHRRSSIQVARAHVVDGRLVCDRDTSLSGPILPMERP
jgi:hypothetical protein